MTFASVAISGQIRQIETVRYTIESNAKSCIQLRATRCNPARIIASYAAARVLSNAKVKLAEGSVATRTTVEINIRMYDNKQNREFVT